MSEGGAYGGATFAGSVVRVCALRKTGVVDAIFLSLSNFPTDGFEAILSNGSIGRAIALERRDFGPADKLQPALVYSQVSSSVLQFSVVGEPSTVDVHFGLGTVEARQRELDALAVAYKADREHDPWFDAERVATVVCLQVRLKFDAGYDERVMLVPVAGRAQGLEAVQLAIEELSKGGAMVDAWSYGRNILPVPGNGTMLSWTESSDFTSAESYADAYWARGGTEIGAHHRIGD